MKTLLERLIFIGVCVSLVACKKGMPDLATLRSLSGFELSQSSVTVKSKTQPQFTLTGKCDSQFYDFDISFDDGKTWKPIKSVASATSINCNPNGTFSLTFNSNLSSFVISNSNASSTVWKFRALSEIGYSDIKSLAILVNSGLHAISGGSHNTTSGTYTLKGRLSGTSSLASGGGYVLKGAVSRQ